MRKSLVLILFWGLMSVRPAPAQQAEPGLDFFAEDAVLKKLLSQALEANPMLQSAWSRYRAALQKVPQVRSLPDPMLTFTQAIQSVETRVGPQMNLLSISQRLPWFGKLDLRGQMALKDAASRYHEYKAMQWRLITQVKEVYFELLQAQAALEILNQEQSLLGHYERLAQSRYATGGGLQQNVIRIQSELGQILNRLELLEQQRKTLTARLNTLMSQPPETELPTSRLPDPPPVGELELDQLYRVAQRNRPELKAALSQIEKNDQQMQLAKKEFRPDVTIGAGFINLGERSDPMGRLLPPPDNGKNAYNISIGINLPIWGSRYRAGIQEAVETKLAEKQRYRSLLDEMELNIREQLLRLETVSRQIKLFDQVLLPQNEASLQSIESGYQTGQLGVLDLLDGERTLFQLRLMRVRLVADYHQALARLEGALGTKFPKEVTSDE